MSRVRLTSIYIMMKNYFALLAICLFTSLSSSNLNAQSDYDIYNIFMENPIKYTVLQEDNEYYLYNKKDNPTCNIKVIFFFPEKTFRLSKYEEIQSLFVAGFFGEEYKNMSPKDAIKTYIKNNTDAYKQQLEKSGLYKKEEQEVLSRNGDPSEIHSLFSYETILRNTIMFNKGNIVSQVINIYEYAGGAHGSSTTRGLIVDLHTGTLIKFDDIFFDSVDQQISDILLTHLLQKRNLSNKEDLYEIGFDFDNFPLTDNFIIDDKGITFIYNQYELGAFSLGTVEIFVPYWDLLPYMKRTSVIAKLIRIDKME